MSVDGDDRDACLRLLLQLDRRIEQLQRAAEQHPELERYLDAIETAKQRPSKSQISNIDNALLRGEKELMFLVFMPLADEKDNRRNRASALSVRDIDEALKKHEFRKDAAAELGLDPKQLYNRIRQSDFLRARWPIRRKRQS